MSIYLPYAKAEYPLLKKLGIYLLNWVLWALPAIADSAADDVGDTYQGILRFIVATAIAAGLNIALFDHLYFGWFWWQITLLELASYLFFGMLYYLHSWRWGM